MKKLLLKMIPLAMLSAAFFPACTEENKETPKEPVFPESVTKYIEPSGEVTVVFSANLDWKVSIPQNADVFRISDGSQDVFSVRGKAAENVSVTVKCTAESQDFENHTVDLTLEMGGKSQVIASIILPSAERLLNLTVADLNESGDAFVPSTDSSLDWTYSGSAVEAGGNINMLWDVAAKKYVVYVRFDANYEWKFNPNPEGIEVAGGKTSGTYKEYAFSLDVPNLGETKTIPFSVTATDDEAATTSFNIVVPAFIPTFAAYKVVVKDGYFEYSTDSESPFQYEFEKEAMEDKASVELVWPEDREGFAYYVLVDANFPYEVTVPEWLSVSDTLARGSKVQYTFVPKKLSLEAQAGAVVFKMNGNDFSRSFTMTQPAAKDIHIDDIPALLEANAEGMIKDMNGEFSIKDKQYFITSPGKLTIYKFLKNGEFFYADGTSMSTGALADVSWAEFSDEWNKNEDALQSYGAYIKILNNSADARTALIVGLPEHVAKEINDPNFDLLNDEGNDVNPKFAKYLVVKIEQQGVTGPAGAPVEAVDPEYWPMSYGNFSELTQETEGWDYDDISNFNCENNYRVIHGAETSESYETVGEFCSLKFNRPYTGYRIYRFMSFVQPVEETEKFWVKVEKTPQSTVNILMTPKNAPDGDEYTAYIVFYDEEGDFAAILCRYDPKFDFTGSGEGGEGGDSAVDFAYPEYAAMEGSVLTELVPGTPEYEEFVTNAGIWGSPKAYHLTFVKEYANMSALKGLPADGMSYAPGWLEYEYSTDSQTVFMNPTIFDDFGPDEPRVISSVIVFSGPDGAPSLVLACTLDLSATSAQ